MNRRRLSFSASGNSNHRSLSRFSRHWFPNGPSVTWQLLHKVVLHTLNTLHALLFYLVHTASIPYQVQLTSNSKSIPDSHSRSVCLPAVSSPNTHNSTTMPPPLWSPNSSDSACSADGRRAGRSTVRAVRVALCRNSTTTMGMVAVIGLLAGRRCVMMSASRPYL